MSDVVPSVVIVSPALADANNGNWRTASRWRAMLSGRFRVRIVDRWPDGPSAADDRAMLALHAQRSASSIAAWLARHSGEGLAVTLTGTDLYAGAAVDPVALAGLEGARRLVVLQDRAPLELPEALRAKCRVIYQSTSTRSPLGKTSRHLRAVMVGHLRAVKSPGTLFEAARLLRAERDILIDHIGDAVEPRWAELARATQRDCPNYRWLGAMPHEAARRRIQRAHLLVHPSRIEGGAHVVMEAICSGTPVLASRIEGNVGMLGADYAGYFPHGDAPALAALLRRCRDALVHPQTDATNLLATLERQCGQRAPLFSPERERFALRRLVDELIQPISEAPG